MRKHNGLQQNWKFMKGIDSDLALKNDYIAWKNISGMKNIVKMRQTESCFSIASFNNCLYKYLQKLCNASKDWT